MKQQKYKEETISGWANQGDTNYDAIMLTNILIRKATAGKLPQINYIRNKTEMQYPEQHTNSHLLLPRAKFSQKSNHTLKMKREKTEGCDYRLHEKSAFKEQNKQFAIKQLQNISNSPQQVSSLQKTQDLKCFSHMGQDKSIIRVPMQSSKSEVSNSIFSKTMKTRSNNSKSQDALQKAINFIEISKKSQQRLHVRLSTLEMSAHKKQFRYECLRKLNETKCKIEEQDNQFEMRRKKKQYKIKGNSIDKMNQKLKSTFTKKDIFDNNKRKLSKNDNVEFSDQVLFSNNSIVVSKQMMTNPFLYSKIQILKQPIKNQLVFK